MKRPIRITESQLYDLIEQTLNELDMRTMANAANHAQQKYSKYDRMATDTSNDVITRRYANTMKNRKEKQKNKFVNAVNNELRGEGEVPNAKFSPSSDPTSRGNMTADTRTLYGSYGALPIHPQSVEMDDMRQYLRGASYYDKKSGTWLNPWDEDYDVKQSEPWAEIRKKHRWIPESLVHKIAEGVIRKLRKG